MNVYEATALGILQGLTEFLPVSSSGHLVIGQALFGVRSPGISFEVFVHFGTLLSIFVMFRRDVLRLLKSIGIIFTGFRGVTQAYRENTDFRTAVAIVIGTIPAGFIGIAFKDVIENAFNSVAFVGAALIVTGGLLALTRLAINRSATIGAGRALIIGVAQAFAILPGISRAGSSISAAMFTGVSGEEAARFSFLLAIPAIGGATLLHLQDIPGAAGSGITGMNLAAGIVSSFVTGCAAIWLLMGAVRKGRLSMFSYYCFAAGGAALAFLT